ncbi:MAG: DUF1501 domain-containing protein [Woeseiaceae bacterium]|nr:DUF1501 domain-containing protein [Woeseiaceae bacterium]
MIGRRDVLKALGLGTTVAALPAVSFAATPGDRRFVLVILRGAFDGLALAAPHGDRHYRALRGELALPPPDASNGVLELDDLFGLHPSLRNLHDGFRSGEALVVHAVASPYRERSHFDGQDVLENGGADVGVLRDGWLNRALAPLGSRLGSERAIAMSQNTPLVLRGGQSVTSWAPSRLPQAEDSTLERLQDLYADDAFFATRLAQALTSQAIAAGDDGMRSDPRRGNEAALLKSTMQATARFLTAEDGPTIAVLEAGGWDTHANQGAVAGQLANRFADLDAALAELKRELGDAWQHTVVAVATEFGRTVRVNGTRGTDHGTATAAILAGGAVAGGRVIGDWPGLADRDLYQGRDLRPTTDLRSVWKAVLQQHIGLSASFIDRDVFPDSAAAPPLPNVIRG